MCRIGIVLAMIALVATSCVDEGRSVEVHDQPRGVWSASEEFYYENEDSLSKRDIAIVLRYDNGKVADSLALNIMAISPDSLVVIEPFVLHIPRLGDLRPEEQTFPYRRDVVFSQKGRYRIKLSPTSVAEGISSVGIVVSEHSKE